MIELIYTVAAVGIFTLIIVAELWPELWPERKRKRRKK